MNQRQYNRIMKGKPTIISFNTTHFRCMKQDGAGSILSSLPALTKIVSKASPVLKRILPGLATGIASTLGSLGIDSLLGNGIDGKKGDIIQALAIVSNELN